MASCTCAIVVSTTSNRAWAPSTAGTAHNAPIRESFTRQSYGSVWLQANRHNASELGEFDESGRRNAESFLGVVAQRSSRHRTDEEQLRRHSTESLNWSPIRKSSCSCSGV